MTETTVTRDDILGIYVGAQAEVHYIVREGFIEQYGYNPNPGDEKYLDFVAGARWAIDFVAKGYLDAAH